MGEAVKFLSDAGTFYVATVSGDKPKVRPFGIAVEYEGKIYFFTNSQKDVYKQLIANSNFEVSATAKDGNWIRIKGNAVFENNIEVKKKAFEILPVLASLYQSPDNPDFVAFYASEGEATIYSRTEAPKAFKI
jgi:uncharacterized pyridoxamine 5'-phosphate oxidase family protein